MSIKKSKVLPFVTTVQYGPRWYYAKWNKLDSMGNIVNNIVITLYGDRWYIVMVNLKCIEMSNHYVVCLKLTIFHANYTYNFFKWEKIQPCNIFYFLL